MRYQDGQWVFRPDFTNNLVALAVQVDSPSPRIGYPLEVAVEIGALEDKTMTVTSMSPAEAPNLFIIDMEPDRRAIILDRTAYNYADQAELGVVNSDAGGPSAGA